MKIKATNGSPNFVFYCPGCKEYHGVWVDVKNPLTSASWKFDGNMEKPTISPSILVKGRDCNWDENKNPIPNTLHDTICHSFVRNGMIEFLEDCTHDLKGQTVELPEIE